MLGFITSFGVYASIIEKKESVKLTSKKECKSTSKSQLKVYTEYCYEIAVYIGSCPDGTTYLAGVGVYIYDCDTYDIVAEALLDESDDDDSCL